MFTIDCLYSHFDGFIVVNLNITQSPTNPIKNDTKKSNAVSDLFTKSLEAKYRIKINIERKMVGM